MKAHVAGMVPQRAGTLSIARLSYNHAMLKTLRDLFDALLPPRADAPPAHAEHALQLATAVLLVEVMRSDPQITDSEREAVLAALKSEFGLRADEGERLVELAQRASREATDYFAFTSKINEAFEMPQKIAIVEHMWRVAYADGVLGAHENHVMRRLSDLLHIPHGAYVSAKARARGASGVD
jgi:uncharacterized tellurite resistance protein B-like protein